MNEYAATVLRPVCPECGMDVSALLRSIDLDWRDERERITGENARAVQEHRASAHVVAPALGDLVAYFQPWRGMLIGSGPLLVRGIREYDINEYARSMGQTHLEVELGVKYWLADPSRPGSQGQWSWPSTGDIRSPITFEILAEYVAPIKAATLLDLLGDEWWDEDEL
ncbi:hypothetical protein SRABI98_03559 [Microbacterium sp. Bi98]|uniref:hypothetical protein n=1 Tax=Microbacterium sp. Bi98 TaxID=2821116 RepID=UPI001D3CC237|nr:hypothetical protein [Microbacterium sp. Bi98]CAH0263093.1 hypothetical protein SRABI98_03559 [Microbacterium sp. Bi98]